MTESKKPVYPSHSDVFQTGLSLREYYAGMFAMKLLDRSKINYNGRDVSHVDMAVLLADDLIDSLNRIKESKDETVD